METCTKPRATEQFHLCAKEQLLKALKRSWKPENRHIRSILDEASPEDIRLFIADSARGIVGIRMRVEGGCTIDIEQRPVNRAIDSLHDLFRRHLIVSACLGGILWGQELLEERKRNYKAIGGAYINPDEEEGIEGQERTLALLRTMLRPSSRRVHTGTQYS